MNQMNRRAQALASANHPRRPSKIRPVPIHLMRVPPALVTQREFRPAWGNALASSLDLDKLGFIIVNFRDGVYWVLDGQHRVYALKENGFTSEKDTIDCEVYENLTDEESAEIFLGRDDRKALTVFDKFHVACTAGRPRETGVRRAVESNGLRITRMRDEGCIAAVAALLKVYDMAGGGKAGEVLLGNALRTIRDAFASDPSGFDPHVIQGVALVFHRYGRQVRESDLTARLAATDHGVRGLLRRAVTQQERTGNSKAHCVAAVVVDIFNKSAGRSEKLAPWLQTEDA